MAKKINLAELSIDDKALLKSTQDVKKALDALKAEQKELTKVGLDSSKVFIQNSADIKVLSSAYNENVKVMAQRVKGISDMEGRQDQLNLALSVEAETIEDLRAQNKLLNKLRNSANILTQEGQEELTKLNSKLDENNEKIKENVDQYTQQKINIGNYKDSIKEAFEELNIFNGGLGGFVSRSKEAGGVGPLVAGSLKKMANGFVGLTRSALAFIATPIGAVLTAIVGIIALVSNAMSRNEGSMNKLKKALAPLTGLFQKLLGALEPVGEFLIDNLVVAFELVEKAVNQALKNLSKALGFLGLESASRGVSNFADKIEEVSKNSKILADAEAQLTKNRRVAELVQKTYLTALEKERQIRDDTSLLISERIGANERIAKLLKQQGEDELALAQQSLAVTKMKIQFEGERTDLLDEQAEAMLRIADIEERLSGVASEQLTNRVSLQKEAQEKAKAIADEQINDLKTITELYISSQGHRAKSDTEELAFQKEVSEKRIEILKAELKNKNITYNEYLLGVQEIENELLALTAENAVRIAERELDIFKSTHESKLDANKYFNDALLEQELERLAKLKEAELEFAETKLSEGVINQEAYQAQIREIEEAFRVEKEEAETLRAEAKKEKEITDLELKQEIDEERFLNQFEKDSFRLEAQRIRDVENAEKSGADITLINQKHKQQQQKIDEAYQEAKVQSVSDTLGNVADILGKETAAGKASALAQALVNTYQGVTQVWKSPSTLPEPFATVSKVASTGVVLASGLGAVKSISGVSTKLEQGGIVQIDGARHSGGGVPIYAGNQYVGEAEGGEGIGVLSRSAFAPFMAYNTEFGTGNSYNGKYAGGGIISQTVKRDNGGSQINRSIQEMVNKLSRPVVTVEDINAGQQNQAIIENGANS